MDANAEWISRQDQSDETRRDYERERLQLWTMEAIADLISESSLTKADLARKLGTSRAHITQLMSGSRNPTLSTIADLAWANGKRAVVKFEPLRSGAFISTPVVLVHAAKKIRPMSDEPVNRSEGVVEYEFTGVCGQ